MSSIKGVVEARSAIGTRHEDVTCTRAERSHARVSSGFLNAPGYESDLAELEKSKTCRSRDGWWVDGAILQVEGPVFVVINPAYCILLLPHFGKSKEI